ncbi:MAG: 4Fe-4S dicluster domain-containing protein [Gemmatimonadetes bacterium]|nr:4Fe-4S dicluster domain-containing protein [Gemmatimonadota bacterium]
MTERVTGGRVTGGRETGGEGKLGLVLAAQHDRLSNCVHCGFCLPACPTYVRLYDEADSPRGRLYLMGAVAEGRLDPASDAFQLHLDRCLGCRACETVCPSGVEYGFLLERAREVARDARPSSFLSRALLVAIQSPVPFAIWMGTSRLLRWSRIPSLLVRILPSSGMLGTARFGMAMLGASLPWRPPAMRVEAGRAVRDDMAASPATTPPPGPGERGRVAILTGCIQDQLFRRVNRATERVLRANGWEVVSVSGQGCCGALHAHGGALTDAREMARRNVRAFQATGVDWIVANAAGCGATMREYGHLLEEGAEPSAREHAPSEDASGPNGRADDERDRAAGRWFSGRVRDITEILAGEGRSPRRGAPLPIRVAYDPPCHLLHGQRVRTPPLELLGSIPKVTVVPVPNGDECCGGAGIYGITHPDLGGRVGGDKVSAVLGTHADVLVTGNPGCAMQIGAGLRMKGSGMQIAHPVEILDESYRRAGFYAG